jgi:hypothetical protein
VLFFLVFNLVVQNIFACGSVEVEKFHWCGIFYLVYKRGITDSGNISAHPNAKIKNTNQNRTLQTNVKKKKLLDLTVKIWDKNNLLLIFKSRHSEY